MMGVVVLWLGVAILRWPERASKKVSFESR